MPVEASGVWGSMEAYPARGLGMRVGKGDSERVWGHAADREGASGKIGAKTGFSYLVKQEARRRDPPRRSTEDAHARLFGASAPGEAHSSPAFLGILYPQPRRLARPLLMRLRPT